MMSGGVLLVNPPAWRQCEEHDSPVEPRLSIGYLAAVLRDAGLPVRVLDAKLERFDLESTATRIIAAAPDLVGFTAVTADIEQVRALARRLRRALPDRAMILGGAHASALPERTLREIPEIDALCLNEAESILPELARRMLNGATYQDLRGIAGRTPDGEIYLTSPASLPDPETLPFPAWDLLPRAAEYPVLTARGCPHHCAYCRPMSSPRRVRSAASVAKEVRWLVSAFTPRMLHFRDETFTHDRVRSMALLDALAPLLEHGPYWTAGTRVATLDEELVDRLYAAGCRSLGLGIEGSRASELRAKEIDVMRAQMLIARARRQGMEVRTFFILGHPDETAADMLRSLRLARRLAPSYPVFSLMTPYPGTRIYELAIREETGYKLAAHNWNDYNKQLGHAMRFAVVGTTRVAALRLLGYVWFFMAPRNWPQAFRFVKLYRAMLPAAIAGMLRTVWPVASVDRQCGS